MSALLAPDPAVPQRDRLLDERRMAAILGRRLTGAPGERCVRLNAKYRVGDSLRVAYRVEAGGRAHTVAARTFPGRSDHVYRRASAAAVPVDEVPAVLHEPELETVFWTFPNDRRLSALRLLSVGGLDRLVGPGVSAELVAYAPERAATLQCLRRGRLVAYVKVHWDAAERELGAIRAVSAAIGADDAHLRVPRLVGFSAEHGALLLEPLPGRRLDAIADVAPALEALGGALARMHALPRPSRRFDRADAERLRVAADVIGRARPDCRDAAAALLARLESRATDGDGDPVHLHGDPNLRNALLDGSRVALVDLEDVAAGPAAADLGFLLGGLLAARVRQHVHADADPAAALLRGYGRLAVVPTDGELRWHAAASVLARIAVPAVGRVRPAALATLRPLLHEAEALLR